MFKIAAIAGLAMASQAMAGEILLIDVNSLRAEASGVSGANPFDTGYTGTLTLSDDANSVLQDIRIDFDSVAFTGSLGSFLATINIDNGIVTGGTLNVTDDLGESYNATIANGSGDLEFDAGQFEVDGLTFDGTFSSNTFAGIDVTRWFDEQPLSGSFIDFFLNPDASGVDENADVDILVVVPLPTTAALGVAGLGMVGLRRRR